MKQMIIEGTQDFASSKCVLIIDSSVLFYDKVILESSAWNSIHSTQKRGRISDTVWFSTKP